MTDIAVRKENGNKPTSTAMAEPRWEPFRMMRELMGWDPFRAMAPLSPDTLSGFIPTFEIKETPEGYTFKADVPGVKEKDLEVTITGNRLTISGKREAEKQERTDTYYASERSYGEFLRAFTMPEGIDMGTAHAELNDGVLSLTIRRAATAQPKKIAVQSAAKKP